MVDLKLEPKRLDCAVCGKPRNHHSRTRPGYITHKFVKENPSA
ncbi:MAG TPA: hypothetical protein VK600_01250 [Candidatus Saccharimonadales bacterium]|nr:hypothetical protein [Candidatus Saccharimonadales bacterium]